MKKIILNLSLLLLIFLSFSTIINAQGRQPGQAQINLGANQPYGVPATGTTVGRLVASGIQIAVIFALLLVLVFFIWGAFDWITAGGDKEKIAGARRKIINSVIGLFLLALAGFIISLFGEIAGINPLSPSSRPIPRLGDPPQTLQPPAGTTP